MTTTLAGTALGALQQHGINSLQIPTVTAQFDICCVLQKVLV